MVSAVEETIAFISDRLAACEMAVWCGAGISLPAGLPLAYQLMDQILAATSLDAAEQHRVRDFVKVNLPFERFMETVLDTMDDATRIDLLKIFDLGMPAIGHHFLAALATKKLVRTIFTTNFDTHIETALNDAALKAGEDYEVWHQADRFHEIDWDSDTLRVIKLHGSIESPLELRTTVPRIATPAFRKQIESPVSHAFQRTGAPSLLVLGYSFSDRFDISPLISLCGQRGPTATIVGVQHEALDMLQVGRTIDSYSPRYTMAAQVLRNHAQQQWVFGKTENVIGVISARLGLDLKTAVCQQSPVWLSFLDEFFGGVNARNGNMIGSSLAASLLTMIGADQEAIKYLEEARVRADVFGREFMRLIVRQDLAGAYVRTHLTEKAITELSDAVPIAEAFDNGKHADSVHTHLGALYMQIAEENIRKAQASYNKALAITQADEKSLRNIAPIAGVAHCWMKLGDYDTAKIFYDAALEIVEPTGDVYRKAEVYGNIASWAYIMRDFPMALDWYEKARVMSQTAGDIERVGIHRMNCANVYVKQKKLEVAIEEFEGAREVLATLYWPGHPTLELLDRHLAYARRLLSESQSLSTATRECSATKDEDQETPN